MSEDKKQADARKRKIIKEQLFPLVEKINAICEENDIAHLISVLLRDENGNFGAQTVSYYPDDEPPTPLKHAIRSLNPRANLVELALSFIGEILVYHRSIEMTEDLYYEKYKALFLLDPRTQDAITALFNKSKDREEIAKAECESKKETKQ